MVDPDIYELPFAEYLARVKAFTDEVLIPREHEVVARGSVPPDVVDAMAGIGLFAGSLPREYGGLGLSIEQQVRVMLEFGRASTGFRSRASTTVGLSAQLLLGFGTEEQRQENLPRMAAGDCLTAFALTEESAGSDATAVRTQALPVDGGYVLNGSKRYITNGASCNLLIAFAQVERQGRSSLSSFLVPADAEGVRAQVMEPMNGHRESPVATIEFRDVFVPSASLVGGVEGNGLRQAVRGINFARLLLAAASVAQAVRLLEEATRHALSRSQFGQPIAEFGVIESLLGLSYAEIRAGRAMVLDSANVDLTTTKARYSSSAAKLFCTEMVGRVADRAVQILGGEGIVGDSPVPRMWRDVRALRVYEGTSEIHKRDLGRYVREADFRDDLSAL
jgi:acyl-CoA dehydrogenase